jgi:lysophospholipase L1-like esterase
MKLTSFLTLLFCTSVVVAETPKPSAETPKPEVAAPKKMAGPEVAVTGVPRDGGWLKQHESFNEISKKGEAKLVFLGDSITAGWKGKGKEVWDKYWAPLDAANFGIGGDRTEHVIWRLDHGNFDGLDPKAIVLMIGTNNTGHVGRAQKELDGAIYQCNAQQTADGVKAILARLKKKCAHAKILINAIFPRGEKPTDAMRMQNEATNAIIKGYADGKTVFFMDIGKEFLTEDGTLTAEIMPDRLHPGAAGYEIWASAIESKVKELLK